MTTKARLPTPREVEQWMHETLLHVMHIEYFLHELQVGSSDSQRPHDIIGHANEWDAIRGYALTYAPHGEVRFKKEIEAALAYHRQQQHHQMWNEPNPSATPDNLKLGAVDAICSLIEPRAYQGGAHNYQQIEQLVGTRCKPHTISWLQEMLPSMRRLAQPRLDFITSIDSFPNIGIAPEMYDVTRERVYQTKRMLQEHGYFQRKGCGATGI